MYRGKSIAVVVPCFKEETQIATVIETMPDIIDRIVIIDDASPDSTAEVVRGLQKDHERVELIVHPKNAGVGAAIVTGYQRAIEAGDDVAVVMAGDGQMPPDELPGLLDPVVDDACDYSKANRLASGEAWNQIPRKRYLGNAALSFLTKVASGYYHIADSQTGYTAITTDALKQLDLDAMYPRYGYPNDMLVRLNAARMRVMDVPSRPVYNVGEQSKLKIRRVLFTMSWLLYKRFWWRMGTLYVVRDFHPLVIFYTLGSVLLSIGTLAGFGLFVRFLQGHEITAGTAVLVSLLIQTGLLMSLFGMLFDYEHNRRLTPGAR